MNPQYPVYIVSKGRWQSRLTARHLSRMGVPYRIIVEEFERDAYCAVIDEDKVLTLDPAYQRDYDACCKLEPDESRGPGPARNFAWDHALSLGAEWHWVMDDNIRGFFRLNKNLDAPVADGTIFRCMEDFCLRYTNIGMAGPNYFMFTPRKYKREPFSLNTRIYSCNLIRNDVPFRWRARYNEDTDLSLRMLKDGWCTVLFRAFVQDKIVTQTMDGGCNDEFYKKEGTFRKSKMLVDLHPDVAKLVWRYGRWHHHIDYRKHFRGLNLKRRSDIEIPTGVDEYGMRLISVGRSFVRETREVLTRQLDVGGVVPPAAAPGGVGNGGGAERAVVQPDEPVGPVAKRKRGAAAKQKRPLAKQPRAKRPRVEPKRGKVAGVARQQVDTIEASQIRALVEREQIG